MNVRKPTDYSAMFTALDELMWDELPQMKLYIEIGRLVCARAEKGAAVAAAEYLQSHYPDAAGFSPRNQRRMREFYHTYQDAPELLDLTAEIGWTQNVVILESNLSAENRAWYLRAARRFGWTKSELAQQICEAAHLEIALDCQDAICYTDSINIVRENGNDEDIVRMSWDYLPQPNGRVCDEGLGEESRTDHTVSNRVGSYQPGGDWKSGLSAGTAQAGRVWDLLQRSCRTAAHQQRLRGIRPADWNGQSQPAGYVPDLRRRLCRQNAPSDGLYGPPWRCRRPVVHRRFRGNLARCAVRVSGTTERFDSKGVQQKWISWLFLEQKSVFNKWFNSADENECHVVK